MLRQYHRLKKAHQDAILMFRMGDFYEMFFEDAVAASRDLDITLTARGKGTPNAAPMCGVPYHSVDGYVARLVRKGHKVALCDQTEDPAKARGLVQREVIRVVTPGTFADPEQLAAGDHNFLASLFPDPQGIGAAYLDLSTGDLTLAQVEAGRWDELWDQVELFAPREILVPQDSGAADHIPADLRSRVLVNPVEDWAFSKDSSVRALLELTGAGSLSGFGVDDRILAVCAAGGAVHYLRETQRSDLKHLHRISLYTPADRLILDATTRRNLEITDSLLDSKRAGSLLDLLDETCTPMGSRALKDLLLRPFGRREEVEPRLDAVEAWTRSGETRGRLRRDLARVRDLERLLSRVTLKTASPREYLALKDSLAALPDVKHALRALPDPPALLRDLEARIDPLEDLAALVASAIADDPPALMRDGGYIKDGFHPELDRLRSIRRDGKGFLAALEARERARTGISSLKVRYNRVFGYYLEVSKASLGSVPSDYQRKQTLVGAERFITPELKSYEEQVVSAQELIEDLEGRLLEGVRDRVAREAVRIKASAMALAETDLFASLAEVAVRHGYSRPVLRESGPIRIREGRHPVVERLRSDQRFVPNDTDLDAENRQVLIITGPNMGGKSTYLRQVALIVLMAQAGSFVPASEAEIGMVDRIFCRVGASDNLARGQSTFMVEMQETANILHHATSRSLVILDEIGRGTATFDGLSLAWAVAEYLHDEERARAKTLFATHYHELTELALTLPRVHNCHIAAREWNDEIRFLYRVLEGSADRSYGIQVARLAGLPPKVLQRAREVLNNLEVHELDREGVPRPAGEGTSPIGEARQIMLFAKPDDPIREALRSCRLEEVTPLQALNLLAELKRKAEESKS